MELPTLSQEVADALDDAVDISEWIGQKHPDHVVQTRISMVAAPFFGICLEHREAMLLLFRHGARTSAYALLRSLYEALVRGTWAERCLDEQGLARIVATRALPKFATIVSQLDKKSGEAVYATLKLQVYGPMSDYAHGDVLQLERWATADEIGARHPDHEVVRMLRMVNLFGLLAVYGVGRLAQVPTEEMEAKIAEYSAFIASAGGAT